MVWVFAGELSHTLFALADYDQIMFQRNNKPFDAVIMKVCYTDTGSDCYTNILKRKYFEGSSGLFHPGNILLWSPAQGMVNFVLLRSKIMKIQ